MKKKPIYTPEWYCEDVYFRPDLALRASKLSYSQDIDTDALIARVKGTNLAYIVPVAVLWNTFKPDAKTILTTSTTILPL